MIKPLCENCGAMTRWFRSSGRAKRYCSVRCRAALQGGGGSPKNECPDCGKPCWSERGCNSCSRIIWRWCAVCGDRFRKKPGESAGRCCSRECGFRMQQEVRALRRIAKWEPWRRCRHCRKPYPKVGDRRCGCPDYMPVGPREMNCQRCNRTVVVQGTGPRRYCMACSCEQRRYRRRINNRGKNNHRKRARHYRVEYVPVHKDSIFERDGWRCQRCNVKTRPDWSRHHPRYPTLDHILPMSKGGGHTPWNLQCLCRRCNVGKSNSTVGDQLLIGS